MEANREYKDRLFRLLFGREENKDNILSLYNALNGSDYTDFDAIELTTIEDAIYIGMKNDVSFIIDDRMPLWEQQSTYNPNMPVRQLIYLARIYSKYIEKNDLDYYSSTRIKLPVPRLITFYNGTADAKDETELFLKDLFERSESLESDVSVKVHMLNINYGNNKELLEACKPLNEYAWLVAEIRKNKESMSIKEAVNKSLDENYVFI